MGLAVDEEDSPSPPPPPPQGLFAPHGWPPLPLRLPPPLPPQLPLQPSPHLPQIPNVATPVAATSVTTPIRVKRQFDVASLLASDSSKKEDNEDNESWRSASPPSSQTVVQTASNPLLPHQYLARYYQLVQQHQQQQNSASAAAAALAAAAAAAASNQHHIPEAIPSPRGSPNSPLPERNFWFVNCDLYIKNCVKKLVNTRPLIFCPPPPPLKMYSFNCCCLAKTYLEKKSFRFLKLPKISLSLCKVRLVRKIAEIEMMLNVLSKYFFDLRYYLMLRFYLCNKTDNVAESQLLITERH